MLARNEGGGMDGVRLVSWNVAGRKEPWRELVKMGVDVALLQETGTVPPDVAGGVDVDPNEPWLKHQFSIWPKIVKLSDRVKVEWFKQVDPISETKSDEIAVSGIGTIAAARVIPLNGGDPFVAASMYARWVRPHP